MNALQKFKSSSIFLPLVALAILVIFNIIFVPGFLDVEITQDGRLYGRIFDILNRSSSLIILSLGMTFVIATAGIDISVGAVVAISGAVCCSIIGGRGDGVAENPMIVAMIAGICVGTICGAWNGFLVSKIKIQPMVVTLILMVAGRGIAQLINYEPFRYIGGNIPGNIIPSPIIIAILMIALVLLILKKTSLGLFIQSVGINPTASKYAGINVTLIIFLVYTFSGFCAGVSGLIESSLIRAADANNAGLNMEMDAILAVALGGTLLSGGKFYLGGSIIGAITIQTLTTTMYAIGVASDQLPVVKAIVVIILCLIQSKRFQEMFAKFKSKKAVDKA